MPTGQSPATTTAPRSQVRDGRVGLVEDRGGEVAPLAVGRLEAAGQLGRGGGIGRQQQVRGGGHVADAADGVDARGEREGDPVQVDPLWRHAGRGQQGGDARPGRGAQPGQPETGDGAVLAGDGHHVRDRPDGRQVRQVERGGRAAGLVRQQQLRHLEGDAAAGEAVVRVVAVGRCGLTRATAAGGTGGT